MFSFQPLKNVTTGEGGVVSTDNPVLASRLRRLRFHGLDLSAIDKDTGVRNAMAEVGEPGFKYDLPDMNAVLGVGQLQRLETINAKRQTIANAYTKALACVDEITPLSQPDYSMTHAWHLYVVRSHGECR